MTQRLLYTSILLLFTASLFSQIRGKITDTSGQVLPYATIYVENSTVGTTTNLEGVYSFNLKSGTHRLVYQFVGYKSVAKTVTLEDGKELILDIVLEEESVTLSQIVVSAEAEDPAYAIIRKAISKRKFYKNQLDRYAVDLYIKGLIRTLDAPESMMGMEVGDMSGILDSTRNGVVYLSESKSKLYYKNPDQFKEVMYASKVAGDIDGVSFNQFSDANYSFYDQHINFGRNLLSPIADNALKYYRYQLVGTTIDKYGHQVNKIKVKPKSKNDPCFHGLIYIMDDSWRIHSTDMAFTGAASKVMIFDTINIKQLYIPTDQDKPWVLFSQVMDFKMSLLAFKFSGTFSYFFSNYMINDASIDGVFSDEVFKIEASANEKDSLFWEAERPVPITLEERNDYKKKDSLEVLWKSETYLDSVDRVNNKFKWFSLLAGYTYAKTYHNRYITLKSPLNTLSFNPFQGYRVAANVRYRKWNKKETAYFTVEPTVSYGFSEKKWRGSMLMQKLFNSIDYRTIAIELGRKINQLNENNPINEWFNSFSSLIKKENNLRLFQKDFIRIAARREIFNGWMARANVEYADRISLSQTTNHSWRKRDEVYDQIAFQTFEPHKTLFGSVRVRWRPGQKYMTFGDERVFQRSKWPDFYLNYKRAFKINDQSPNYDFLKLSMRDPYLGIGLWGYFSYNLEVGGFLKKDNVPFIDHYHIEGNPLNFILNSNYLSRFKSVDNYQLSTTENFGVLFSEYHLDGRLMDNIPGVRNWGIKTVFGFNIAKINTDEIMEASIGLEDIGIGGVSLFRVDYAWSFTTTDLFNHGIYFTLSNNIN